MTELAAAHRLMGWGCDVYLAGDGLTATAFSAMLRGLGEVYPDAELVAEGVATTAGGFAIRLGEMAEELPEWMQ